MKQAKFSPLPLFGHNIKACDHLSCSLSLPCVSYWEFETEYSIPDEALPVQTINPGTCSITVGSATFLPFPTNPDAFGDAAIFFFSFCCICDFVWLWFEDRRHFAIYVEINSHQKGGNKGEDIRRCTHGPDRHSPKCWCCAKVEVKKNTYIDLLWDPYSLKWPRGAWLLNRK